MFLGVSQTSRCLIGGRLSLSWFLMNAREDFYEVKDSRSVGHLSAQDWMPHLFLRERRTDLQQWNNNDNELPRRSPFHKIYLLLWTVIPPHNEGAQCSTDWGVLIIQPLVSSDTRNFRLSCMACWPAICVIDEMMSHTSAFRLHLNRSCQSVAQAGFVISVSDVSFYSRLSSSAD